MADTCLILICILYYSCNFANLIVPLDNDWLIIFIIIELDVKCKTLMYDRECVNVHNFSIVLLIPKEVLL